MTLPSRNPLGYMGLNETNPPNITIANRAPLATDYANYDLGDEWLNSTASEFYKLVKKLAGVSTWTGIAGTGAVEVLTGDAGGAIGPDAAENINLLGTIAQGISTLGAGNTITWTIADATEIQKGVLRVNTDAEILAGTSDALAVTPLKLNTKLGTQIASGIPYGATTTAAFSWLTFDNTATRYLANTGGGATTPEWNQIELTNGVIGILPSANGGTGITNVTDHVLVVGSGAAAMTEIGPLTNGQLVIGSTGADPVAASITSTDGSIAITAGAGTLDLSGGGLTWTVVTVNAGITVNTGIVANKAGLLTETLPATAAVGNRIRITGINTAVGWRIAQGANQQIHYGLFSTTAGAGGYIEATAIRDSVELLCVVAGASTEYNVISSIGNITIV